MIEVLRKAYPSAFIPPFYLTSTLIQSFEPGDKRFEEYISATAHIQGTVYYYPFKYKIRQGSPGNINEYYTLLRLAEQYLIRAEARARQNSNITGEIADLNTISDRAEIKDLSY